MLLLIQYTINHAHWCSLSVNAVERLNGPYFWFDKLIMIIQVSICELRMFENVLCQFECSICINNFNLIILRLITKAIIIAMYSNIIVYLKRLFTWLNALINGNWDIVLSQTKIVDILLFEPIISLQSRLSKTCLMV